MFNPMTDRWENEGGKWMLDSSLLFTFQLHDAEYPVPEPATVVMNDLVVGGATSETHPLHVLLRWEKGEVPGGPSRYEAEHSI